MEYLKNVVITASAYWPLAIFILALAILVSVVGRRALNKSSHLTSESKLRIIRRLEIYLSLSQGAALLVFVASIFIGMSSSANTVKVQALDSAAHEQRVQQVETANDQRRQSAGELRDVSRQPDRTSEAREARFNELVDYKKKRAETEPQQ